jgi:hypothetical protein
MAVNPRLRFSIIMLVLALAMLGALHVPVVRARLEQMFSSLPDTPLSRVLAVCMFPVLGGLMWLIAYAVECGMEAIGW